LLRALLPDSESKQDDLMDQTQTGATALLVIRGSTPIEEAVDAAIATNPGLKGLKPGWLRSLQALRIFNVGQWMRISFGERYSLPDEECSALDGAIGLHSRW
jgi:hypothetical protein